MDVGFRSPLVDLFRRGEADHDVRMLAAQGAVALRAPEQLAVLVLLVDDPDPEVRGTAEETIARIPRESLAAFLARPEASGALRDFFAGRGIEPAATPSETTEEPLIEHQETLPAAEAVQMPVAQRLSHMKVGERITAALKGSREERAILIRDVNKVVSAAVLSSPKLSEGEVEVFARMTSVSDDVLRAIAGSRTWLKNYGVVSGLTRNPKTPIAISLGLVPRLLERDLRILVTDRNVSDTLRQVAKKTLLAGEARRH
jgi:hypothetical protein